MNLKAILQRHPLSSYFALAFGITWSGVLALWWVKGFRLASLETQEVMFIFVMMLLGPSTSGLVLTGLLTRRQGLLELRQRLNPARLSLRWTVPVLLTVPALFSLILGVLNRAVSPVYTPDFQWPGLAIGLLAGVFEELGWTGFATPRLLKKYGPFQAGLILGLVWALWHLAADFSGNFSSMGAHWPVWFVVYWILPLTAYRILMTWVNARTHSLLAGQLMHASYTGWLFVLSPAASFEQNLLWQVLFAAGLWTGVMLVMWVEQRKAAFSRQQAEGTL